MKKPKLSARKIHHLTGCSLLALALAIAGSSIAAAADADPAAQGTPAQTAQAQPARSDELETVTVSARYQTENLQQTPISISAITADDLEKKGFTNLTDISKQVPNLKLDPAGAAFGSSAAVFIRGVGQADFHPALDPGVGIYIDGIYYGSLYGDQLDLSDTESVTVLRGPQGTLFGRNTEGGAVLISTVKPKGDNSGYVEVGYGSYNQEQAKGAFDVSVIPDKLAIRVAAGVNSVDGYVDLIDFACANPAATAALNAKNAGAPGWAPLKATTTAPGCVTGQLGGSTTTNLHGSMLITPTDDLQILLTADLLDIRGEEPAAVTTYINPTYPGSLGFLATGYGPIFTSPGHYQSYAGNMNLVNGISYPNVNNTFSWGLGGTIDYKLDDDIHIKNIIGYRKFDNQFNVWLGGSPIALDNNLNELDHHQFSEEFQLTGTTDALLGRRLDWAMGAYYYTAQTQYLSPIVDLTPFGLAFSGNNESVDHNTSGFVHGVYHITDAFSAEVGVRYSTEDKDFRFHVFDPFPGGFNTNCRTDTPADAAKCFKLPYGGGGAQAFQGFGPHIPGIISSSERFDPKVEFAYQWTPDLMTYASVSTGYKGGGVNPRPSAPDQLVTFQPEDLTAYELGSKTQWLDNRLRINADIFVENYKDLQTPFVPPGSAGSIYVNTGHVLLYGTELEVAATPFPGLQIDSSAGWLHNRTLAEGPAGDCATGTLAPNPLMAGCQVNGPLPGQKLAAIPAWKASAGIQYSYDLPADTGVLTPRIDWHYQGTEYFGNQATTVQSVGTGNVITASTVPIIGRQPGYSTFDARLAYDSPDGAWTAAFEVHNLTNEFYYLNGFGLLSTYGNMDESPALPRTYFFNIKRMFGGSPPPSPEVPAVLPVETPAPAPAPAAKAPEAQRQFQVFFDFDKSDITDAAAKVIQAAADAVKAGNVVQLTVTGHTDTVGSAKYNQALSERRAAAVKSGLVADGVSGGEITTLGVGKTGLLVPTADGVREPQNRRAEIVLQ